MMLRYEQKPTWRDFTWSDSIWESRSELAGRAWQIEEPGRLLMRKLGNAAAGVAAGFAVTLGILALLVWLWQSVLALLRSLWHFLLDRIRELASAIRGK